MYPFIVCHYFLLPASIANRLFNLEVVKERHDEQQKPTCTSSYDAEKTPKDMTSVLAFSTDTHSSSIVKTIKIMAPITVVSRHVP